MAGIKSARVCRSAAQVPGSQSRRMFSGAVGQVAIAAVLPSTHATKHNAHNIINT